MLPDSRGHDKMRLTRYVCCAPVLVLLILLFCSSPRALGEDAVSPVLKMVRSYDKGGAKKGGTVYDVAFSPDGKLALIGGDVPQPAMLLWDVETGTAVRRFDPDVRYDPPLFVTYSPDGRLGASGGLKGNIRLRNLESGELEHLLIYPGVVTELAFSPDARRLFAAGTAGTVRGWDVSSGVELLNLGGHTETVSKVVFLPDGRRLLTAGIDKSVRLWDVATGGEVRLLSHPDAVWSMAVSPDGRQVVTGTGGGIEKILPALVYKQGDDNTIRIWDIESGQVLREMRGHSHVVHSLAWDPTGNYIVSGGLDKTLRLWDADTGDELSRVVSEGWVNSVTFSPDGQFVLCGGGMHRDRGQQDTLIPQERVRLFRIDVDNGEAAAPLAP